MMNIKQAKQEIVDTVQAYLLKNEYGEYVIPRVHQRPVLLLGAPGIGKTPVTAQVFCAVSAVTTPVPYTPAALKLLISAKRPAPPDGSTPAIDTTFFMSLFPIVVRFLPSFFPLLPCSARQRPALWPSALLRLRHEAMCRPSEELLAAS